MGISDVSSGLCSSDLGGLLLARRRHRREQQQQRRRIDREYEGEAGDAGPVEAASAIVLVARLALRHAGETRMGPGAAAPRKKSARGHFRPRESLSLYQSFTPVPSRAFGNCDVLPASKQLAGVRGVLDALVQGGLGRGLGLGLAAVLRVDLRQVERGLAVGGHGRSEEHTSELQSLMRISYAVFCLKNKTQ